MLKLHLIDSLSTLHVIQPSVQQIRWKSNRWSLCFSLSHYFVDRRRWNKHVVSLIDTASSMRWRNFF